MFGPLLCFNLFFQNDLKQEKSSCQGSSQMETLQRENAVLRAELLEVQQRRLRDQLLFLNSQKEYQQMKSEHSTLELELDLANDQVDKLESQSTDKQKQLQALYAQIGQLEKQLAAASSAPVGSSVTTKLQEEAAKQLKLREGENTKLKSLIGQLEAELKSSQETNVAFQQALRSSEDQLNMLRQQMQMLQAQQMQYQQQVAMQQQMHYAGYARQMQYAAAAAAGAKMTY
jgi:chromosome segregation ATPase